MLNPFAPIYDLPADSSIFLPSLSHVLAHVGISYGITLAFQLDAYSTPHVTDRVVVDVVFISWVQLRFTALLHRFFNPTA